MAIAWWPTASPAPRRRSAPDYDVSGRLDVAVLDRADVPKDADYYLCGPDELHARHRRRAHCPRRRSPSASRPRRSAPSPSTRPASSRTATGAPHPPDGLARQRPDRDVRPQQPRHPVGRPLPEPARLRRGLRRPGRIRLPTRRLPQLRERLGRRRRHLRPGPTGSRRPRDGCSSAAAGPRPSSPSTCERRVTAGRRSLSGW